MGTEAITEKLHESLHDGKEKLAGKMDEIGNKIEANSERLREASDEVALRLHYGADKVRSLKGENLARELLNRYPVGAMAAAVFFGVLFGRALRR